MKASALHYAASSATSAYDREHVTTYIKSHPNVFRLGVLPAPPALTGSSLSLTVDTADDLERLRELFAVVGKGDAVGLRLDHRRPHPAAGGGVMAGKRRRRGLFGLDVALDHRGAAWHRRGGVCPAGERPDGLARWSTCRRRSSSSAGRSAPCWSVTARATSTTPARAAWRAFRVRDDDVEGLATTLVAMSVRAHRYGLMSLEPEVETLGDSFLRRGLALAVDNSETKVVEEFLAAERAAHEAAEEAPARVFEAAAGYAPTLGILGAVLGLIRVMEDLGDASRSWLGHRGGVRGHRLRRRHRQPAAAADCRPAARAGA